MHAVRLKYKINYKLQYNNHSADKIIRKNSCALCFGFRTAGDSNRLLQLCQFSFLSLHSHTSFIQNHFYLPCKEFLSWNTIAWQPLEYQHVLKPQGISLPGGWQRAAAERCKWFCYATRRYIKHPHLEHTQTSFRQYSPAASWGSMLQMPGRSFDCSKFTSVRTFFLCY